MLTASRALRMAYTAKIEGSTLVWSHTRTVLCITSTTETDGKVTASEERYFNSSLESSALSPEQWLLVVRSHWAVENNAHHTLDTVFAEDDHPFINCDTQGMMAVLVLRRIAYTMLALFRSVTLRSEEKRNMPWRDLLRSIYNTLIAFV
jgi:predicted transposase YbfD/YdcC